MSHLKERSEKICLNCKVVVQGRYCQNCGQENIEPKETVWHLVSHFFEDITHFDGKFFDTLRYLIIRPGFLSKEYLIGRRAKYVNPVRMYIFTSAFFFLIFFSFISVNENVRSAGKVDGKSITEILSMDSTSFANMTRGINRENFGKDIPMTKDQFKKFIDSSSKKENIHINVNGTYSSKSQYDSMLVSGKLQHNWLMRKLVYKQIEINEKYKGDNEQLLKVFLNSLLHSLPQMLFISLPLFALILQLLYFRSKQFYYVNHSIFAIHFYIFVFIAMLILFSLGKLNEHLHWSFIGYLISFLFLGVFFYQYKALRNFYQQRRGKTIAKFLLLNFLFSLIMILLFIIFVFFSFFKI